MVQDPRGREDIGAGFARLTGPRLDCMQMSAEAIESPDSDVLLQDFLANQSESDLNGLNRALEPLDEALREYITDLVTQNKKLGFFAHTVAHDLQGPIYHIAGYTSFLRDVWTTLPEDRLQSCLEMIHRQAQKMGAIVEEISLLAGLQQRKPDSSESRGGRNGTLRRKNDTES